MLRIGAFPVMGEALFFRRFSVFRFAPDLAAVFSTENTLAAPFGGSWQAQTYCLRFIVPLRSLIAELIVTVRGDAGVVGV